LNKGFWEEQARKHGQGVAAVNFDPIQEELMTSLLEELVPDGRAVADVGCGNGRTLLDLVPNRRAGKFVGYDFASTMVDVAEERRKELKLDNVRFHTFDATAPALPDGARNAFDMVLGKRLLINIKGDAKRQALQNIYDMLREGGTYLMIECFIEPLERTNEARKVLGLDRIGVKDFNEYLTADFMMEVERKFTVERMADVASLYYFVSRVFNAALSEGKPDYFAPINKIAAQLMQAGVQPISGYAPEVAYVLKKKANPL